MKQDTIKPLIFEFLRYLVVGGLAFLVDFGTLFLCKEYIIPNLDGWGLYISTSVGFIFGLVFNYIFSVIFVFLDVKDKNKSKTTSAFLIFAAIGIIGLLLTEFGMYIGTDLINIDYRIVKIIITAIVLIWNYLGRKIFIFR